MNFPPPEKRKCDECSNNITINYFRLNSPICRYCEEGIIIPDRLITNHPKTDNNHTDSNYEQVSIIDELKDQKVEEENSTESLPIERQNPVDEKNQLELLS